MKKPKNRLKRTVFFTTSLKEAGADIEKDGPKEIAKKYESYYRNIGQHKIADRYAEAAK